MSNSVSPYFLILLMYKSIRQGSKQIQIYGRQYHRTCSFVGLVTPLLSFSFLLLWVGGAADVCTVIMHQMTMARASSEYVLVETGNRGNTNGMTAQGIS